MGSGGGSSGGGIKSKGFSSESLNKHYAKHKNEFDNISKTQYNAKAKELLNSSNSSEIEGFTSKYGWVFKYNNSTNEFAIMRPDGSISTYFKPKNSYKYWKEQIKKYGQ